MNHIYIPHQADNPIPFLDIIFIAKSITWRMENNLLKFTFFLESTLFQGISVRTNLAEMKLEWH